MDTEPSFQEQRLSILRSFFPHWTSKFSTSDLLGEFGKASLAVLYSELFIPDLEDCEGSILLSWSISSEEMASRFRELKKEADPRKLEEIESSFNFIEIGYLFQPQGRDLEEEQDDFLAHLVAEAWKGCLKSRYPERSFIVEVLPPEITGSVVGVHFYERRQA